MNRLSTPILVAALTSLVPGGLVAPPRAAAESTRIVVRADGTKVIVNEPSEARSRRLADHLLAAPSDEIATAIVRHATDRELDPRLVQALVQVESGYNPRALSNKGAMGLMQLMPGTARDLKVGDPWDFDQNIAGGTTYLRQLVDRFGVLELALAAYNAGPEAVARYDGIPPYKETRDYVRRVLHLFDGSDSALDGRRVNITRDANNQIRLTTASVARP
ncbi:MAG: lytic transglycosylase domain-containing protein [Thermoanaerobaculia bacterium]